MSFKIRIAGCRVDLMVLIPVLDLVEDTILEQLI